MIIADDALLLIIQIIIYNYSYSYVRQLEITKKDYRYYKNLVEKMTRADFDSISVEDISWGLFRFCNSWLLETSKLKSIIDAATKRGERSKRKFQEGKSIQTKIGGIIPGFITENKWSMEVNIYYLTADINVFHTFLCC